MQLRWLAAMTLLSSTLHPRRGFESRDPRIARRSDVYARACIRRHGSRSMRVIHRGLKCTRALRVRIERRIKFNMPRERGRLHRAALQPRFSNRKTDNDGK